MIVLFTNLLHRFFISIHLLYSSTCFEHYCAHLQVDNCSNTASGIVTLFGWLFSTQVTGHPKRVTIPDAVLTQLSPLRWAQQYSKHVEEYNKRIKIKNLCIKLVKKRLSLYSDGRSTKRINIMFAIPKCLTHIWIYKVSNITNFNMLFYYLGQHIYLFININQLED